MDYKRVGNASSVSLSERIQWKIPDFFTIAENLKEGDLTLSPIISSSDCDWTMGFNKKLTIFLWCGYKETAAKKTGTCYVGSERAYFSEKRTNKADVQLSKTTQKFVIFTSAFRLQELKNRKSELVPPDTLTVTFYLEDTDSDPRKQDTQRQMGLENLSRSFQDLFDSKKNTDATIKVKDKDFAAHKAVLVARSSVFTAMFGHNMSEEQTGVVTVPDCDPDSFKDFLHHLYTGKFDCVTCSNAHHLYVTSDKYDVLSLKSFCVDHMKQNLTVENVLDVIALAELYEESELLFLAQDFFNNNFGKVISTSHWRTLFKEDFELANRLLVQMESKMKFVKK